MYDSGTGCDYIQGKGEMWSDIIRDWDSPRETEMRCCGPSWSWSGDLGADSGGRTLKCTEVSHISDKLQ